MQINVMNRWNAVRYCYLRHENPANMISISDPRMGYTDYPFISEEN